jgi:hypothetical protein
MKKFLTMLGLLTCIVHFGFTQDYYLPLGDSKSEAVVLDNSYNGLKMYFTLQGLSGKHIATKTGQDFTELYFGNGYFSGDLGTPKLPAFKRLIQIPFGAEISLKVVGYSEEVFLLQEMGINNRIYPVQPSLRKDMDLEEVPFEFNAKAYQSSGFRSEPMARVEVLGTMRGVRIARVEVMPVEYDPINGMIKIYNDIEVEISYKGANRMITESIHRKTYSPYFESVYSTLANNYSKDVFDDHPDLTKYPVKMLIISNRMFEETLQPYIAWKTKKGFFVDVAYTDVIGTTAAAIQTYIHGIYNSATETDPAPTFLVFVGDVQQVPASATGSSSGKMTDLYYASVDGDYFPEMYYGRLSAQNTNQLQNIINKILYYEQYQFEDPTYLNNATLIAGADGTWNPAVGQPTIKYATANYFNAAHDFNTVWGYGVANDPNNPNNSPGYTGCYSNERISVSFINYTAHCSETSWGDPLLSISAVNAMTNTNKYPLAIGNCCLAADFGYNECIGEAWIRAANKGAVTYIGSSPSSYWFEDFYWAVGAFPIVGNNNGYVPTFEQTTFGAYDAPFVTNYVTAGATIFVGNLAVTEVDIQNYPSHSSPLYYWQAYNVLGDPSLVAYFTEGEENTVSHMAIVPIGLDNYVVNALPGSYVAISKDGVLHGASFVDESGEVEVLIEPILDGGDVDIVITRPQTTPYMVQIPAAALEGPYIVLDSYEINDENENDNGLADFGESFTIHVTLKNVGADDGEGVSAVLTGEDEYFSFVNVDPIEFGNIAAGETGNTSTVVNAFTFTLANNVPDQYKATFVLEITDGDDVWNSNLKITANAPVLGMGNLLIDDGGEGVPNYLEPGESAQVVLTLTNTGKAAAQGVVAWIAAASPFFNIIEGESTVDVEAEAEVQVTFSVEANASTPDGHEVQIDYGAGLGVYEAEGSEAITVGPKPESTIGEGNEDTQSYYPLDNYYKANKSQMLYQASEVSLAPQTIKELGLYMKSIGTVNPYVNLTIKLMETDLTVMPSAYVTTTGATTVFSASSYTMPSEVGWLVFDIEDFEYSGEQNLLVEVTFGINASWTSTRYRVSCTTTPSNSVTYGYSDTQAIPSYSGVTNKRPNLYLSFDADYADFFPVSISVEDIYQAAIPDAEVIIGSLPLVTDEDGQQSLELPSGSYPWTASKAGYIPQSGVLAVDEGATDLLIVLPFLIGDEAEILTFGFEEDVVEFVTIAPVEDNAATIFVGVAAGTDVSLLTPTITVSYGATIVPMGGVAMDFSAPVTFVVTSEDGQTENTYTVVVSEVYTVTFRVNMTNADGFDPAEDVVYLTGSMLGWAEPGTLPEEQAMTREEGTMTWSVTHQLAAGDYQYKYFLNEGWDGGEWEGDPNRTVSVSEDMVVEDSWGIKPNVGTSVLSNVSVYPNPFSGHITLSQADMVTRVVITNIVGQVVVDRPVTATQESVETGSLSRGVYLVTLMASNGERVTIKMIKQ